MRIAIGIVVGFVGATVLAIGLGFALSFVGSYPTIIGAAHLASWGYLAWRIGRRPVDQSLPALVATPTISEPPPETVEPIAVDEVPTSSFSRPEQTSPARRPIRGPLVVAFVTLAIVGVVGVLGFAVGASSAPPPPAPTTTSTATTASMVAWPISEVNGTCGAFDSAGNVSWCFGLADDLQGRDCSIEVFRAIIKLESQGASLWDEGIMEIEAENDCFR